MSYESALDVLALTPTMLAMSNGMARLYAWLDLDREELAGFALILVYWSTLLLAHYYFETRVMSDRVRAEIWIARQRAASLRVRRPRIGAADNNGNGGAPASLAAPRRSESTLASANGIASVLVIGAEPTDVTLLARGTSAPDDAFEPVVCLLDKAEETLDAESPGWRRFGRFVMTFLGWESAPELSALQLLNAADIDTWSHVSDEAAISARIVQAHSQLGELTPDQQYVWRRQFACFWRGDGRPTPLDPLPRRRGAPRSGAAARPVVDTDRALAAWRSRLCAFLDDLYESRQVRNARLSSLQQKASWGVLITLWALVALVAGGDGRVLLAGAIGGLMSRLTRFTGIRWLTTDFGLGWAQLYLAPPVGALAAWGGIHTLLLVQRFGTVDLQKVLSGPDAQGTGKHAASVLGLAIALGFSERIFDRLLRRAADTIVPPAEASQPSSAPTGVRAL
jgi:hypothetical protein